MCEAGTQQGARHIVPVEYQIAHVEGEHITVVEERDGVAVSMSGSTLGPGLFAFNLHRLCLRKTYGSSSAPQLALPKYRMSREISLADPVCLTSGWWHLGGTRTA
jgi:hypothetical protein